MSKASVDLPDPETPVTTVNFPRGISTLMFFRLCSRAWLTLMLLLLLRSGESSKTLPLPPWGGRGLG
jgi:hypothetical protein